MAGKGVEVGAGYISLYADAGDLVGQLSKQIAGEMSKTISRHLAGAGSDAAQQFGDKFEQTARADIAGVSRKLGDTLEQDLAGAGGRVGDELADQIGGAGTAASGGFADGFGSSASSKLGGVATKLGEIVKGGIVAVAAAAGAALAKGVTDAYAAEAANDRLAAQLGLPPDRAAELGKAAGDIYRGAYGESLGEVNDTIAAIFQTGLLPEDAIEADVEAVSAKLFDLSSTFDLETREIARSASQLVKTGLAGNVDQAIDLITRAGQQGVDISGDLLDTVNEYGVQFQSFGIDGATAFGLISQAQRAGVRDADLAADAIKEFGLKMREGSDDSRAALTAIGFDAETMVERFRAGGPEAASAMDEVLDAMRGLSPSQLQQVGPALVGTQFEDMQASILAFDPSSAAAGLGTIEGAADKLGATLNDNAMVKIEAFKRQALGGLADFAADYAIPAIARLGDIAQTYVLPKMQQLGQWLQTNVVPALQQLGGWVNDNVVPALVTFAGFVTGTVVPAVQSFAGWLVDQLNPVVQALVGRVQALVPHLQDIGARITTDVLPPVQEMWQRFHDDVLPILRTVAEFIVGKLLPVYIELQSKLDSYVLPVLGRLISFVGQVIGAQVQLYDTLKGFGGAVVGFVGDAKGQLDNLVGFISGLPGRISSAASGMFDGIRNAFRSAINWIVDGWNGLEFSIPGVDTKIPGVGTIGGFTLGTPNIPRLATGGVIDRPTLALVGETQRARPEIVTPERLMRSVFADELDQRGRGDVQIENHFHNARVDANEAARALAWELRATGVL